MTTNLLLETVQQKSFVDIPASVPAVKISLPKVGITNRPCYIQVQDPFTGELVRLFGAVKILFGLPASQRGVHMSRIEECLSAMASEPGSSLTFWSQHLLEKLIEKQQLTNCAVNLDIRYEKATTKNSSLLTSHEMVTLHAAIEKDENGVRICTGLTVPFINACPCTQRWGMREFYELLTSKGYAPDQAQELVHQAPLQAHTNLGQASLKVWSSKSQYSDLYNLLDRAVPIVRELLKGVDEHTFVRHAHKEGQFCEDNTRKIIYEVVREFNNTLEDDTLVEITVEVEESVHFHNLYTEVKSAFGDLRKSLLNQQA